MDPLTIVVSFDVGEQVVPCGIPCWITSLVHEFGFDRAKAAFHRRIVEAISLPAHGLDHPGCVEDLAVIGGRILAAAIRMMDEARRRLLALDGHGQSRDGQFCPHVIAHCPANDLPREKIEHDSQIKPAFSGLDISKISEPDLIWASGNEVLIEPVGGDRQIMMAVRGAYPETPRHYCLDTVMAHEAFNTATARHVPQAAQGRVDSRRAITSAMSHMEPPDLTQQDAIGRLAQAFGPAAPSIIPCRRDAHDIAQGADWEHLALFLDQAKFHFGGSEKMRSVL